MNMPYHDPGRIKDVIKAAYHGDPLPVSSIAVHSHSHEIELPVGEDAFRLEIVIACRRSNHFNLSGEVFLLAYLAEGTYREAANKLHQSESYIFERVNRFLNRSVRGMEENLQCRCDAAWDEMFEKSSGSVSF